MNNKKTLYIHVTDPSTTFLAELYKDDINATVLSGGLSKQAVIEHIKNHERIVFLGHGTCRGLLNCAAFFDTNGYIIDDEAVPILKQKCNTVFIWCYASDFQQTHGLDGFSSYMFISQEDELWAGDLPQTDAKYIEDSNIKFVSILKECIHLSNKEIYKHVKAEYGKVAATNPVAKYNCEHLYQFTK